MKEKKEFKCPICGCNEYYRIDMLGQKRIEKNYVLNDPKNPYGGSHWETNIIMPKSILYYELITRYLEGSVSLEVGDNVNARLCKECGYVSLFATGLLDRLKSEEEALKKEQEEINAKLNSLNKEKKELLEKIEPMYERLKELGKLLSSEDITIKQQKEYKEEVKKLESEIKQSKKRLDPIDEEISLLEKKLK